MASRRSALEQENEDLRAALIRQWERNHADSCERDWPHDGYCHWPVPDVLRLPVGLVGFVDDGW